MPVAAFVAVVVLDRVNDEARALAASVLDFAAGVDDARRVVGVDEVDHVGADVEERDADLAERPVEVGAQRRVARAIAADADIGDEERDEPSRSRASA